MRVTAVQVHSSRKEELLMQLAKKNCWKLWVHFSIGQVPLITISLIWLDKKLWFQIRKTNQVGICIQKLKYLGSLAAILNSKGKLLLLQRIIPRKKTRISQIYSFQLEDNLDLWCLQVLRKYKSKFHISIQILRKDFQLKILKVMI